MPRSISGRDGTYIYNLTERKRKSRYSQVNRRCSYQLRPENTKGLKNTDFNEEARHQCLQLYRILLPYKHQWIPIWQNIKGKRTRERVPAALKPYKITTFMYVYVCTYAWGLQRSSAPVNTYPRAHLHVCICMRECICMLVCMYVCVYVCVYVCRCIQMYVCMCIWTKR